mmetsp:Transcript_3941/g.9285  ORF Transcript_3941/g.9285 Transcript_3941/m.9285 type:complete len:400 (-) Transcript_3941:64-1263(-)
MKGIGVKESHRDHSVFIVDPSLTPPPRSVTPPPRSVLGSPGTEVVVPGEPVGERVVSCGILGSQIAGSCSPMRRPYCRKEVEKSESSTRRSQVVFAEDLGLEINSTNAAEAEMGAASTRLGCRTELQTHRTPWKQHIVEKLLRDILEEPNVAHKTFKEVRYALEDKLNCSRNSTKKNRRAIRRFVAAVYRGKVLTTLNKKLKDPHIKAKTFKELRHELEDDLREKRNSLKSVRQKIRHEALLQSIRHEKRHEAVTELRERNAIFDKDNVKKTLRGILKESHFAEKTFKELRCALEDELNYKRNSLKKFTNEIREIVLMMLRERRDADVFTPVPPSSRARRRSLPLKPTPQKPDPFLMSQKTESQRKTLQAFLNETKANRSGCKRYGRPQRHKHFTLDIQ